MMTLRGGDSDGASTLASAEDENAAAAPADDGEPLGDRSAGDGRAADDGATARDGGAAMFDASGVEAVDVEAEAEAEQAQAHGPGAAASAGAGATAAAAADDSAGSASRPVRRPGVALPVMAARRRTPP
jgi:hypothetical protein